MTKRFSEPVLLIGAGPVGRLHALEAARFTATAVAADGGADTAARFGIPLTLLIGDLDSVSKESLDRHKDRYIHDPDQNSTDFEKCLNYIDAPLIVGIGFLGGRLDHELAVMNALAAHPAQKVVLLGEYDVVFRCPRRLAINLPEGTRLSLFPMGPVSGLSSDGLKFPLEGLSMNSAGKIGTSNLTIADQQIVEVGEGPLLVIVPRRHLGSVIGTLSD